MQANAFQARGGNQVSVASTTALAVTASAQQLTLPAVPSDGASVRLANIGTQTVFWLYGNMAVTASGTALGQPLLPNTVEVFTMPPGLTQISAIAAATGSTLYATIGDGI